MSETAGEAIARAAGVVIDSVRQTGDDAVEPWCQNDWNERPTVERLSVIHDLMDDPGVCAYFRRGEPGQDPEGTCSFGCREEPNCMTGRWGPWPSELLREVIHDLSQTEAT